MRIDWATEVVYVMPNHNGSIDLLDIYTLDIMGPDPFSFYLPSWMKAI